MARDDHRILLLDLLSVHFIRDSESSTIISYHPRREQTENGQPKKVTDRHGHVHHARAIPQEPKEELQPPQPKDLGTSARQLSQRIHLAGQSVYWQGLFSTSPDPTFVLITYLWHALYAWDEALETLYQYVCWLVRGLHFLMVKKSGLLSSVGVGISSHQNIRDGLDPRATYHSCTSFVSL